MEKRKLYRSNTERMVGGVCGVLAQFFDLDVSIVRLIFVLLGLFGGNGVLIYLIMLLVVPPEPTSSLPTTPPAPPEPPVVP